MKKVTFLLIVIIMIFSFSTTEAQIKNRPLVTIDVLGGYDLPLLGMGGSEIKNFWFFDNYGISNAFGGGVNVKLTVASKEKYQLGIYSTMNYTQGWNSNDVAYNIGGINNSNEIGPGWPGGSQYLYPVATQGTSSARMNIFSFGLGCEAGVYLGKEQKSSFNFGLDIDASIITGRVYNTYPDKEIFYTIPGTLRFGFGANIIYNLKVTPVLGLNFGTRFQFHNLLGSNFENTTRTDGWWVPLNDGASNIPGTTSGTRYIASINLFTGVSFYIGTR
jgi:hypothetical protein